MDFGKAFTFIFEDPEWKKKIIIATALILGSSIFSILIVGLAGFVIWSGYGVRLLQNVRDGKEHPLPEWDDWGGDFVRGLKYLVISLGWSLPIVIAYFFFMGSIIASSIASASMQTMDGSELLGLISLPIFYCFMCLAMIYGLLIALLIAAAQPGYTISFAQNEHIDDGFRIPSIWRWTRANLGQVIIAVLIIIGAGYAFQLVAMFAGLLMICIGLIVTLPLYIVVYSIFRNHLFGQLANLYPYPDAGQVKLPTPEPATAEITAESPAQITASTDIVESTDEGSAEDSTAAPTGDESAEDSSDIDRSE